MAVDENGKLITGEMSDYQVESVALVDWPANGKKFLERRGLTAEEVQALEAQGLAIAPEETPAEAPAPSWAEAFKSAVTKSIQDALKPFTQILSLKGSEPMADYATQSPANEADAAIPSAGLSPEAKAEVQQMIDASIKAALDAYKKEDACQDAADDACQDANMMAAKAAEDQAQAEKAASDQMQQLAALVQKQAEENAKLTALVQQTLTARGAGQAPPSGNADHVEAVAEKSGVWGNSPLMAAVYRGAANA